MAESSPYSKYLNLLGQWPTGLAMASQWFMYFDLNDVGVLWNGIEETLRQKESYFGSSGWMISNGSVRYLIDSALQTSSMGCVFARQVDLPGDAFDAKHNGLDYGGYQSPTTSNTRQKYLPLKITFLETNASFLDLIIRPWLVAASYNGLVARPRGSAKNTKASYCDVCMLAKTGEGKSMIIRKILRFYNVVPIGFSGEQYSYMTDDMKYTAVDFAYDGYYVVSPSKAEPFITNNTPGTFA
jgi:hypothetical protein